MWKKVAIAIVALLVLLAVGGYFFLRSLVSDESVRTTLESALSEGLGQRVEIGRAHLVFTPKIGIELADVALGNPVRVRLGSVRLATGLRPLLNRRVEHAEAIVERGQIELPLPPLGGSAASATAPSETTALPSAGGVGITLVSVDTIALRNIEVKSGDRTLVVDLETALTADRLDIKRIAARADQTVIEGTGVVTDLAKLQGSLDLKANELDLDRLITFLSSFAPESAAPAPPSPAAARQAPPPAVATARPAASSVPAPDARLVVTFAAPKGQMAGIAFTDLSTKATVTPTTIALDPLTFGIFGGTYNGTLTLDVTAPTPAFTWSATLDRVNVAEALKYAGAADVMTGTLSGRIQLTGAGADAAEALKTVKGSGRVDVRDGTLPTLKLVGAVVQAVGKKGEQPAGSGEVFTTLGGSFTLANSVMTSKDLTLDSRDLDVNAAGTVSLAAGTLDVRGNLQLSEEASKRLGSDVTRLAGQGGRVTLPAVVTGPLAQPNVSVDVGSVAKRAITSEMQRQLEKGLGGLLKKKKGGG